MCYNFRAVGAQSFGPRSTNFGAEAGRSIPGTQATGGRSIGLLPAMLYEVGGAKLQAHLHFMWLLHVVLGFLLRDALELEFLG
jgi:hypothetical protein